jgi:hypothetical protein
MLPINNSDTAWLIVTDYNQDNNLLYEDLRNDILNPETNKWTYEYHGRHVGDNMVASVGSVFSDNMSVMGSGFLVGYGDINLDVLGAYVGWFGGREGLHVGGNYHYPN